MDKQELLQEVRRASSRKEITRQELLSAYTDGTLTEDRHGNISKVLYYIGGAVVLAGIVILVAQNWRELSNFTKVLVTFGSGIAAYIAGILFYQQKEFIGVGNAFQLIAAIMLPFGMFITLDIAGVTLGSGIQSLVFGLLSVVYLASIWAYQRNIFALFSVLFGTIFFFTFTNYLVLLQGVSAWDIQTFTEYRFLVVGLSLMTLGYALSSQRYGALSGPLYGFGVLAFLGAAFSLGGFSPDQNVFWETIFPGLVFAILFLSVYLQSNSFLVFGSLFLFAFIFKITAAYFTDTLGWPFALVLLGFLLIAIGYAVIVVRKRYFQTR